MVHIIFYTADPDRLPLLKEDVYSKCNKDEYSLLFFDYPMDVLDYVYQTNPKDCIVFFETNELVHTLEISRRIYAINPRYRFALLCPEYGDDVEELFKMGVSYYIRTPYLEASINSCVENFTMFFNDQSGKNLQLKSKRGTDSIKVEKIRYIMSDKRKLVICLDDDNELTYYCKLDEVEEELGESFLRCHQSYLVNMKKIKQFVEDGLTLENDEFVPVSRKKYYAAKREYLSYITGNKLEYL